MPFILFFLFLFSACGRSYLSLSQEKVDVRYLASTHARTPDPRQANPPMGQRIIMNWWLPSQIFAQKPRLDLHLIFWNNTEKIISYPLRSRVGTKVYFLLGEEFITTEGILTYKAAIVTENGEVFSEWKHQLWVNLIHFEGEEPYLPPPEVESHMNRLEEIEDEEEDNTQLYIPEGEGEKREDVREI
jgi:hypothetical protein